MGLELELTVGRHISTKFRLGDRQIGSGSLGGEVFVAEPVGSPVLPIPGAGIAPPVLGPCVVEMLSPGLLSSLGGAKLVVKLLRGQLGVHSAFLLPLFDTDLIGEGDLAGWAYFTREAKPGETLATRLANGTFSGEDRYGFALTLLEGLAALHRLGFVHGLAPHNIYWKKCWRLGPSTTHSGPDSGVNSACQVDVQKLLDLIDPAAMPLTLRDDCGWAMSAFLSLSGRVVPATPSEPSVPQIRRGAEGVVTAKIPIAPVQGTLVYVLRPSRRALPLPRPLEAMFESEARVVGLVAASSLEGIEIPVGPTREIIFRAVVSKGLVRLGEALTISPVEDPSGVRARRIGRNVQVTMNWPEDPNVTQVQVAWGPAINSSNPEKHQSTTLRVTRPTYQTKGAIEIMGRGVEALKVMAGRPVVDSLSGDLIWSAGVFVSADEFRHVVMYSITTARDELTLTLRCETSAILPELAVVAGTDRRPVALNDGEVVLRVQAGILIGSSPRSWRKQLTDSQLLNFSVYVDEQETVRVSSIELIEE